MHMYISTHNIWTCVLTGTIFFLLLLSFSMAVCMLRGGTLTSNIPAMCFYDILINQLTFAKKLVVTYKSFGGLCEVGMKDNL